jgi:hypothetical protein
MLSLCLICAPAWAQGLIMSQIADGGGWQTTIVLTNTTANPASFSLGFYMDTGDGATQNWDLGFLESGSTQSATISAGATLLFHSAGTASSATTGWGQLNADAGVTGYALISQSVSGQANQDSVATAVAPGNRVLVPFDNTGGGSTMVTLVNASNSSQTISAAFRTPDGTVTQGSLSSVPAQGHLVFPLATQFSSLSGQSGLAEFYNAGGSFSLIATQSDSSGGMTSSPVHVQTGAPILVSAGGSSGGGALPTFSSIHVTGTFSPTSQTPYQIAINIAVPLSSVTTTGAYVLAPYTVAGFAIVFQTTTVNGQTITLGGLQPGNGGTMTDSKLTQYGITSASLSLTLTPQTVATTGSVSGTLSLTSSLATLSGPVTGSYVLFQ